MPPGRKRLNPKLREAEGAYRKDPGERPVDTLNEIAGRPEPSELTVQSDELTLALHEQVCDTLEKMGILFTADKILLEAFVCNWRELIRCQLQLRREEFSYTNEKGGQSKNPTLAAYSILMANHLKMMSELGLTPSARARLVAPIERGENESISKILKDL